MITLVGDPIEILVVVLWKIVEPLLLWDSHVGDYMVLSYVNGFWANKNVKSYLLSEEDLNSLIIVRLEIVSYVNGL